MKTIKITIALFAFCNVLFAYQPSKGIIKKSELIFQPDDVSFRSCHASTITETDEGLMVAWFGGTHEKHKDVGIWVSKYINGNWTKPVEVANGVQHKDKRYPCWNPVLFSNGDEIKLFYKVGPNCADWWGEVISTNNFGETWSASRRLPEDIWGPIKNKPVMLKNGDLICPSSTEYDGWRVHVEITSDMGTTWERTRALNDGKELSVIQPTLLVHGGNKLQMLCRSKNNRIMSSWSDDAGRTWTGFEPIALPNPNSGIDAVTLSDGRFLLVYNHIGVDKSKWGSRNILNLAISENGTDWEAVAILENDPDKDAEYSYPAVIQGKDGLIHITYTWKRKSIKHLVIDLANVKTKPIKNGLWPVGMDNPY